MVWQPTTRMQPSGVSLEVESNEVSRFARQRARLNANISFDGTRR